MFWEIGLSEDGKKVLVNPQAQNSYSYAGNNPIVNKDPGGRIIDSIADAGFIGYDIYNIFKAYSNKQSTKEHWTSLGLDTVGALVPFVSGLGLVGKGAAHGDDLGKGFGYILKNESEIKIVANSIADHAYNKHILNPKNLIEKEFASYFSKKQDLVNYVEGTIKNTQKDNVKILKDGRTAYWDNSKKAVVIHNSSKPEKSTVFAPSSGKKYFDKLK